MSDVSHLLHQLGEGDPQAAAQLLPIVYDELKRLANVKLAGEKPGQTLQPTALVHEAYLKLVGTGPTINYANRQQFFATAAEAMRRILVDQARRKLAIRNGGRCNRLEELPEISDELQTPEFTVLIDDLMDRLAQKNLRAAEVAKMRLFLQMTFLEISSVIGISADVAETDWSYARAWLKREWNRS